MGTNREAPRYAVFSSSFFVLSPLSAICRTSSASVQLVALLLLLTATELSLGGNSPYTSIRTRKPETTQLNIGGFYASNLNFISTKKPQNVGQPHESCPKYKNFATFP